MYEKIIQQHSVESLQALHKIFEKEISDVWIKDYILQTNNFYGEITTQRFYNFTFLFDYTGNPLNDGIDACAIPDSRVVGVFGITEERIFSENRKHMSRLRGITKHYQYYGGIYERGHFIAHMAGGQIDINLFPQRRDVNRGWNGMWRYREMEIYVSKNPGLLVFSRPIYHDFSCRPYFFEFGFIDKNLAVTVETFPNIYA